MEKRKDVQLFMLCDHHVDYLMDNEVITPLECGADVHDNNVCALKDNTGDNISVLNEFYLENTGVYWIWKNVKDAKYKGQTQYRRQFKHIELFDFEKIFEKYDVIVPEPLNLPHIFDDPGCTLEFHYKVSHNIKDLLILEDIIKDLYPDYYEDYCKYIKNGFNIIYSNGFIMKSKDYDDYCEMLFNILNEYIKRQNFTSIDDIRQYVIKGYENNEFPDWTAHQGVSMKDKIKYQMRIGGSLAERFLTLFIFHNFKNILYLRYDVMEDIKI